MNDGKMMSLVVLIAALCVVIGILIGLRIGSSKYEGKSYELGAGTYNVVQVMGKTQEPISGQELLVSNLDDPTNHHFVVVSDKCYELNSDVGANLLIVTDDDDCIWTRRQPESP